LPGPGADGVVRASRTVRRPPDQRGEGLYSVHTRGHSIRRIPAGTPDTIKALTVACPSAILALVDGPAGKSAEGPWSAEVLRD
jgi:hypothetical protein